MGQSCQLLCAMMGQEAGRQREAWQTLCNPISGGGHRPLIKMTHYGGNNHGEFNGFTALGKNIGTSESSQRDSDYVKEHSVLNFRI